LPAQATIDAQIKERTPVWLALSELFLEGEASDLNHSELANILAASPYSLAELYIILRYEVSPVLRTNLSPFMPIPISRDWERFDQAWLTVELTKRLGRRPWFTRKPPKIILKQWQVLERTILKARSQIPSS
jgi:hypothetical protein